MRSQRARSSICYAENVSDDDDFEPLVRSSARRQQSTRSSAQKRKERPNPKERAEAMQLERAIKESLNDVAVRSSASFRPDTDAVPSIAFQCLLDVTYEEERSKAFENTEKDEACKQERSERQQEDLQDNHDNTTVENRAERNTNPYSFVKKEDTDEARSQEDLSDDDGEETRNSGDEREAAKSTHPSRIPKKTNVSCFARRLKRKVVKEEQEKEEKELLHQQALEGESTGAVFETNSIEAMTKDSTVKKGGDSSLAPDDLLLAVQSSSTLPQRRVMGLSRRFRPPSLHPYLTS